MKRIAMVLMVCFMLVLSGCSPSNETLSFDFKKSSAMEKTLQSNKETVYGLRVYDQQFYFLKFNKEERKVAGVYQLDLKTDKITKEPVKLSADHENYLLDYMPYNGGNLYIERQTTSENNAPYELNVKRMKDGKSETILTGKTMSSLDTYMFEELGDDVYFMLPDIDRNEQSVMNLYVYTKEGELKKIDSKPSENIAIHGTTILYQPFLLGDEKICYQVVENDKNYLYYGTYKGMEKKEIPDLSILCGTLNDQLILRFDHKFVAYNMEDSASEDVFEGDILYLSRIQNDSLLFTSAADLETQTVKNTKNYLLQDDKSTIQIKELETGPKDTMMMYTSKDVTLLQTYTNDFYFSFYEK